MHDAQMLHRRASTYVHAHATHVHVHAMHVHGCQCMHSAYMLRRPQPGPRLPWLWLGCGTAIACRECGFGSTIEREIGACRIQHHVHIQRGCRCSEIRGARHDRDGSAGGQAASCVGVCVCGPVHPKQAGPQIATQPVHGGHARRAGNTPRSSCIIAPGCWCSRCISVLVLVLSHAASSETVAPTWPMVV